LSNGKVSVNADVPCTLLASQSSCLVEVACVTACDGIHNEGTCPGPSLLKHKSAAVTYSISQYCSLFSRYTQLAVPITRIKLQAISHQNSSARQSCKMQDNRYRPFSHVHKDTWLSPSSCHTILATWAQELLRVFTMVLSQDPSSHQQKHESNAIQMCITKPKTSNNESTS